MTITADDLGVFRDGLCLHSRRDAKREAELWVRQHANLKTGLVFVIGIGGGHHIRALCEKRADLVVVGLDLDEELTRGQGLCLSELSQVVGLEAGQYGLTVAPSMTQMDLWQQLRQLYVGGFSVCRFRPSWQGRENEFTILEEWLRSSAIESLSYSWRLRMPKWDSQWAVNVKTAAAHLQNGPTVANSKEAAAVMALMELVR